MKRDRLIAHVAVLEVAILIWLGLGLGGCGDGGSARPPTASGNGDPADTAGVSFADLNLEAAVRAALGNPTGTLSSTALRSLTTLGATGREIVDLRGIEKLDSLTSLDLSDNRIVDLSPLAGLDRLVFLDLSNNQVSDLSPLADLPRLQILAASYNLVRDAAPLLGLDSLVSVELSGNPLEGTAVSEQLPALRGRGVEVEFATLAPRRGTILYAADWAGNFDLYAIEVSGRQVLQLTRNAANDRCPALSPDGSRIAFATDSAGNYDLELLSLADGTVTSLVTSAVDEAQPCWSPDGTRVVYAAGDWLPPRRLTDPTTVYYHGREWIELDLYVVELASGTTTRLTERWGNDQQPSWSPDGERIAFISDRSGSGELYLIDADGGDPVRLASNVDQRYAPTWHPGGGELVFVRDGDLWVFELADQSERNLTQEILLPAGGGSWSVDGEWLAFLADGEGQREIALVAGTGGTATYLGTGNGGTQAWDLCWVPQYLSAFAAAGLDWTGPPAPPPVRFTDPALEAVVRTALMAGAGELIPEQVAYLRELPPCYDCEIRDLDGIQALTRLTYLSLGRNAIGDLTPLVALRNLTELYLNQNQIIDLSPLAGLSRLSRLELDNNRIADLTPLSGLTEIWRLSLGNNQIEDLSPLQGLTKLTRLVLIANRVSDLTPLAGMQSLKNLSLSQNQVTDLTPLLQLPELTTLYLRGNPLSDQALQVQVPLLRERGVDVRL